MRVVLDTNVLISALLFTGVSSDIVPLWQKGAVTILLSREILEEYLRVLAYPKFKLSRQEIRGLIEGDLLPFFEIVNLGRRRLKVVITDPSDDKFLECAVAGKADVLISGDKALLAIGRYRRVQIQNPSQFLDAFFG